MSMFAGLTLRRRRAGDEPPEAVRLALPPRFEAVAEALLAGVDVRGACAVVGRRLARDGAALDEALTGLRTTYRLVLGVAPTFDAAESLSVAWSDATLQYLHGVSCEDPLTGLASRAHLRSRMHEMYREAEATGVPVRGSHALVVVELVPLRPDRPADGRLDRTLARDETRAFTRALHLVQLTEAMRAVYSGGETFGRLGPERAGALVRREPGFGVSVALLRDVLADLDLGGSVVRVWTVSLPASADHLGQLLDDLAR